MDRAPGGQLLARARYLPTDATARVPVGGGHAATYEDRRPQRRGLAS
jgi:hypothetical protein